MCTLCLLPFDNSCSVKEVRCQSIKKSLSLCQYGSEDSQPTLGLKRLHLKLMLLPSPCATVLLYLDPTPAFLLTLVLLPRCYLLSSQGKDGLHVCRLMPIQSMLLPGLSQSTRGPAWEETLRSWWSVHVCSCFQIASGIFQLLPVLFCTPKTEVDSTVQPGKMTKQECPVGVR